MLPCLDLAKHLHDDRRLAAAGIPDDLEVLILGAFGNAQKVPAIVHFDSDAGTLDGFVELIRPDQNWPFEPAPILHFLPSPNVFRNRPWELDQEEDSSQQELSSEDPRERLAVVDLLLEIMLNANPRERGRHAPREEDHASLASRIGQLKSKRLAIRLWS